jgi:YaaC-like Protein
MPEIKACKPLIAENPIDEIWRQLRFFTDCEYAASEIIEHHNIVKSQQSNIKKQARQIGYCIQQAQEYFDAAKQVSLATQPVLLYYGAVSLGSALQLLCKDGSYSFDALRKSNKHRHHGLEFNRAVKDSKNNQNIRDFLSNLKFKIHQKDGSPHGHFGIFYDCLVSTGFHIEDDFSHGGHSFLRDDVYHGLEKRPIDNLLNQTFSVLDLASTLPDMFTYLKEVGIDANLCPGSLKRNFTNNLSSSNLSMHAETLVTSVFNIDSINESQRGKLMPFLQTKIPSLQMISNFDSSLSFQINGTLEECENLYYPDIISDIHGQEFYVVEPESHVLEPAAYFCIMYCFGMLARYFPDVWMGTLENAKITQFIDILLTVFLRKFPHLMLNQLTSTLYYTGPRR